MVRQKNIARHVLLLCLLAGIASGAWAQKKNDIIRLEAFSDSTRFLVGFGEGREDYQLPKSDMSTLGASGISLYVYDADTKEKLCQQHITINFSGMPSYKNVITEISSAGWQVFSKTCDGGHYWIKYSGGRGERSAGSNNANTCWFGRGDFRMLPYDKLRFYNTNEIDSIIDANKAKPIIGSSWHDSVKVNRQKDYTCITYKRTYNDAPIDGDEYKEDIRYLYVTHPHELPWGYYFHRLDIIALFNYQSWLRESVRSEKGSDDGITFEQSKDEFNTYLDRVRGSVVKEFLQKTYTIEAETIWFANDAMRKYYESYLAGHPIDEEKGPMTEAERQQVVTTLQILEEWLLGKNDYFGEHTPEAESAVRGLIATLVAALLANAAATSGSGGVGGMFGSSGSTPPVEPKEPENEWDRIQNRYMRRRDDGYDVTDPATGRTVHFTDNGDGTYTGPNDWGTLSEEELVNEIGFRERNAGISAQDQQRAAQNLSEQRQQEQARQQRERETGHIESISAEQYREWKAEHDEQLKKEMQRLDLISKYGTDKKGLIKARMMQEQMAAEQDYKEAMARADFNDKVVTVLSYTEKASDVAINVLADITGPEGKAIKDAYTMLKSIGKHVGEAAATRQTTAEDLFKALSYGTVQGGLGLVSNHSGDYKDKLGGWGSMAAGLGSSMASAGLDAYKNGKPITEAMGQAGLKQMYATGLGKVTSPIGKVFGDTPLSNSLVTNATNLFHSNYTGPAIDKSVDDWRKSYTSLIDRAVQISNETAEKN